jgi:two-component SAPR family response regulator
VSTAARWPGERPAADRIEALGRFSVTVAGAPIESWRGGRSRRLFQYLLTHAGQLIAKHTLIQAVWGDSSARSPDVALKVAVCMLRNVLVDAHRRGRGRGREPAIWIVSGGGGYGLRLGDVDVYVTLLEQALLSADGHLHAGRLAEAEYELESAVALYRGAYLPECDASWATVRRERLADRVLAALTELAARAGTRGDQPRVLELHQRMLDIDPCREESYRVLMRWHGAASQPSRVQHWYLACAEQLRTRLDLEPDGQTRDLFYEAVRGRLAVAGSGRGE